MTFLALSIQQSSLMEQKSELEYLEMIYSNDYDYVTGKLADLASDQSVDMESRAVKALQAQQQFYDSKKASIESRLKVINAQLESYDKAVTQNVKTECKLSISV